MSANKKKKGGKTRSELQVDSPDPKNNQYYAVLEKYHGASGGGNVILSDGRVIHCTLNKLTKKLSKGITTGSLCLVILCEDYGVIKTGAGMGNPPGIIYHVFRSDQLSLLKKSLPPELESILKLESKNLISASTQATYLQSIGKYLKPMLMRFSLCHR